MPRATATPAELEQRLQAGEWLHPGEVATLFGMTRGAVVYWLNNGVMLDGSRFRIRFTKSPGGWRSCNPEDVTRVLAAHRRERIAGEPDVTEPSD
jgi:hypothetical protein